jgi:hypothetical protein
MRLGCPVAGLLAAGLSVHARSTAQPTAVSPLVPEERDPFTELKELKDLNPVYTDATQMEKLFNKTHRAPMQKLRSLSTKECAHLKYGSTYDTYDVESYSGPKSDHPAIFNLGSYKSGSTSVDAAVEKMHRRACKVGWGDLGDEGAAIAFKADAALAYKRCPIWDDNNENCGPNVAPIRRAPTQCTVVGDAPWMWVWPKVLRAYPKAKIILSRQKTCADWVYHMQGLWNAGIGGGNAQECWYDGPTPQQWYNRCVETERTIVLTAQMLKMPLLVLHATGARSSGNMQKLAKFLGIKVSSTANYPHVHTPSKHKGEKEPPADAHDPNGDLWGGWNGGVPFGDFPRRPPSLQNFSNWVSQL